MTTTSHRIVAVYDDPNALNAAVDRLTSMQVRRDEIAIQQGDDRALAARLGADASPGPTRPVETAPRFWLGVALALCGAAAGGLIGALVFLPFGIEVLPIWVEILVFAAIGALAAGTYAFVMAAGSGTQPRRETDESRADQWMTVSVPAPPAEAPRLRRLLRESGAVKVVERG